MKFKLFGAVLTTITAFIVNTAHAEVGAKQSDAAQFQNHQEQIGEPAGAAKPSAQQVIQNWKAKPKEVAQTMIQKYGQPDEVTSQRLVWHDKGPWKETELVNEEIEHNFPKPHQDMLKQTVLLQVPTEKLQDLAEYDGSVIVDRTPGEISARCDKEEMNFLALNLAHDIIQGKRSASESRDFYAKTVMAFMKGDKHPYTQGLQFQPMRAAQAATPDEPSPIIQEKAGAPLEQKE
ncbi:MAG: hypothetical protein H0X66_13110 [Verrucomicrobia bacterium]|nr:hypothetical protein [Verrucomicrobiota bacterium]